MPKYKVIVKSEYHTTVYVEAEDEKEAKNSAEDFVVNHPEKYRAKYYDDFSSDTWDIKKLEDKKRRN